MPWTRKVWRPVRKRLLDHPDFLGSAVGHRPERLPIHHEARGFRFTSPVPVAVEAEQHGAWSALHGKEILAGQADAHLLLPRMECADGVSYVVSAHLARRLTKRGVNVAMFELPYHSPAQAARQRLHQKLPFGRSWFMWRRPTHQAMADAQALIACLKEQGSPRIGLWGISLGAWLSGMLACTDSRVDFAVLMTPVALTGSGSLPKWTSAPIRRSLGGAKVRARFPESRQPADRR